MRGYLKPVYNKFLSFVEIALFHLMNYTPLVRRRKCDSALTTTLIINSYGI